MPGSRAHPRSSTPIPFYLLPSQLSAGPPRAIGARDCRSPRHRWRYAAPAPGGSLRCRVEQAPLKIAPSTFLPPEVLRIICQSADTKELTGVTHEKLVKGLTSKRTSFVGQVEF